FYTLHVLATALFSKPPFRSCIAHGVVLGDDGRKLSKRLRNFPDPEEVFARQGADAMRWYLLSSPVLRGQDVVIESKALAEPVRLVLNPIWNTWYFLSLYSNADGMRGRWRTDQAGTLDRYVLAKARRLVEQVTASMERNDLAGATSAISEFLDALTNWYVRRSRERFWRAGAGPSADGGDKQDAYDTLHTVLDVLCRVAAPFLPFLAEAVYRDLTGQRSVHLARWPADDDLPSDDELVDAMDLVREISSAGHSIRKAAGRRARLPLRTLTVAGPAAERLSSNDAEALVALIVDEVNVKRVVLEDHVEAIANQVLVVVPSVLGPRLGSATQAVIAGARRGEWTKTPDGVEVAGTRLVGGEYSLQLRPLDETASRLLPGGHGLVMLDLETDGDLEAEGVARDLVRLIQQARREAGLDVADRIHVRIEVAPVTAEAAERWRDYISAQVLAKQLTIVPATDNCSDDGDQSVHPGDGIDALAGIQLERVASG
ncbi:MAG TPA: class I tRNA ligase family protein, partial [Acidimicrobiales bacterium]|nr:class I tRNA ligase family protein [Acidimicrobiales bacterium]